MEKEASYHQPHRRWVGWLGSKCQCSRKRARATAEPALTRVPVPVLGYFSGPNKDSVQRKPLPRDDRWESKAAQSTSYSFLLEKTEASLQNTDLLMAAGVHLCLSVQPMDLRIQSLKVWTLEGKYFIIKGARIKMPHPGSYACKHQCSGQHWVTQLDHQSPGRKVCHTKPTLRALLTKVHQDPWKHPSITGHQSSDMKRHTHLRPLWPTFFKPYCFREKI